MPEDNLKIHTQKVSISPFSRAAVQIEMLRLGEEGDEIAKAHATGFHWEHNGLLHLVTNWHVVTGINPETNLAIGTFTPNAIRTKYFVENAVDANDPKGQHLLASVGSTLKLNGDDPLEGWLQHPTGKEVDLVALPLDWQASQDFEPICLNLTRIQPDFDGEVGDDIFIVGYPEGTSFDRQMPLWKRGTIATDVSLDQSGKRQFYVDTTGNQGLSGSLVLHKNNLSLIGGEGGKVKNKFSFAGIYAGRLGDKGIRSQIGRVLKPEVLFETLDAV